MKPTMIVSLLFALAILLASAGPVVRAAEPEVETQATPQTQLYIRTIPPDAKVQIDGKPRGTAPLLITLPPEVGKVLVEIELDGFASRKREILVDGGRITRLELKLREQTHRDSALESSVMARRSAQGAEPKLGRLDLRIVPTRDASKTQIPQADIDRYVEQLGREGPFVGRDRGDEYSWYQLRCTDALNHISAEHEGRRFILLCNRPAEVMLAIGWNVGPWKLHGIMATEDQRGLPSITIEMDKLAGNRLEDLTGQFLGSQLAMLVDEQVVSMPTIRSLIGQRIQITGRFTHEEVEKLVRALRSSVVPPRESQTVSFLDRHFVRLVVGKDKMTFEGQETTWDELPKLLGAVPDRANTVLEIAIASDEISVGARNSARTRASLMAHRQGFEYLSDIGVHPLGSKGTASQKVPRKGNNGETGGNTRDSQLELQRRVEAHIRSICRSLKLYQMDIGAYPSTEQGLEAFLSLPSGLRNESRWRGPYVEDNVPLDPWGSPYQYRSPGRWQPDKFDLWSLGPDRVDGTKDDIHNRPPAQPPLPSEPLR